MTWIKSKYDALKAWYNKDDNFLKVVRFPGTKLPLLDVLRDFFKLFTKGRTIDRAAGVAFNFFVALFPLVLFFFTLVPYIPVPFLEKGVMFALSDIVPAQTYNFVTKTIQGIMDQPHDGLLSISIFLCLVFGSSGIVAFFNGFRNVYANYVSDKSLTFKGWIIQRLFAIFMLIIIGVLLILSVLLISVGGRVLFTLVEQGVLAKGKYLFYVFSVLRWVVAIIALSFGVALLYYFGNVRFNEHYRKKLKHPTRKGKQYREFVLFSPGTILTTTLFVLGTVGFNAYISNFSRYDMLYGSIGTLIILLLWIWIVAILVLTGNDLNSGIRRKVDKLSASEDNKRQKQIVIDSLRRSIKTQEQAIETRTHKIERLRKDIQDKELLIHDLEEEIKDSELIISAYQGFLQQQMRASDQENLRMDSMRERIASDEKEVVTSDENAE